MNGRVGGEGSGDAVSDVIKVSVKKPGLAILIMQASRGAQ